MPGNYGNYNRFSINIINIHAMSCARCSTCARLKDSSTPTFADQERYSISRPWCATTGTTTTANGQKLTTLSIKSCCRSLSVVKRKRTQTRTGSLHAPLTHSLYILYRYRILLLRLLIKNDERRNNIVADK